METLNLLTLLSEATGPTGYEESVCNVVRELWLPFVDEIRVDAMGSLVAVQRGTGPAPRPTVMAAAHMDEIGLIVTGIENEFLHLHALGGVDRRVLLGLEVCVHGRKDLPGEPSGGLAGEPAGCVAGVIGSRPPHVLPASERQDVLPWHEIFVDLGLSAEEVKARVRVGDYVTVRQPLVALKNGRAAGKAFDNRASVAALTLALETLRRQKHVWDFYAVATVQEEVGIKGAITSAYGIDPDIAVALDVTFAKQHGDSDPGVFELGEGPTIGVGPNFHPDMVKRLKEAAEADEVPFVIEPLSGSSGTDAWGIQLTREGVPSGLISIPVRYMHQPVEVVALRDIERAGRLLSGFVTRLEPVYRPEWEDEG